MSSLQKKSTSLMFVEKIFNPLNIKIVLKMSGSSTITINFSGITLDFFSFRFDTFYYAVFQRSFDPFFVVSYYKKNGSGLLGHTVKSYKSLECFFLNTVHLSLGEPTLSWLGTEIIRLFYT